MKLYQRKTLWYDLILILAGSLIGYLLFPVLDVSNLLLGILSKEVSSYKLLQLLVSSILVILVLSGIFLVHSYDFRKRYQHKKIYRFGVYWYKHKPYCPFCGGKLIEYPLVNCFDCENCKERIIPWDFLKNYPPKIRDILEIIRKET